MMTKVKAVFRKGAFYPSDPVSVADGEEVELTIESDESSASLIDLLEEVAKLSGDEQPQEATKPVNGSSTPIRVAVKKP